MITIHPSQPVIIAGPTASGKSATALHIAQSQGGVIINADASQVFQGWPILTAQPPSQDRAAAPHVLYGHQPYHAAYTLADWLADVASHLGGLRPIIVGGTGLYITTLTQGMSAIPETPARLRRQAMTLDLASMIAALDPATQAAIDLQNPRRVQRAWEVQMHTGQGLAHWFAKRDPALLPESQAACLVLEAPKDWLTPRIAQRFDQMCAAGALDEARAMQANWDPALQSSKAIGAAWMIDHLRGDMDFATLREKTIIATRQYAKRQRTWFRSQMGHWARLQISSTKLSTALQFAT